MRLSTNTRYAIRVLFGLLKAAEPVPIPLLAEKTGISTKVVESIHTVLRGEGITASVIGSKGGIRLARPLGEISLGTLVALFDDGVEFGVCFGNKSNDCPKQDVCPTRAVWKTVSAGVQASLNGISLETVLKTYGPNSSPDNMPVICLGEG